MFCTVLYTAKKLPICCYNFAACTEFLTEKEFKICQSLFSLKIKLKCF